MLNPCSGFSSRFIRCLVVVSAIPLLCAVPSSAQNRAPIAEPPAITGPTEPPISDSVRIDRLFERLKTAPDVASARQAAERIERAFEKSGSDTADLLLQRAKQSIEAKNFGTALDLLDFVVTLKPDWAEAYHRRAIVHFLQKDEEAAMRDVRATLAREPRHWHALAGLGALFRQMGLTKSAYKAYRAALDIYPHFADLKDTIDKMRPEIEGNPV